MFIDYSIPDDASCPQRQVHVWLQHGSYPVINASSTDEFPTEKFYMERSYMDWLTLKSAFKPSETLVHPIYAPEPGTYNLHTIYWQISNEGLLLFLFNFTIIFFIGSLKVF